MLQDQFLISTLAQNSRVFLDQNLFKDFKKKYFQDLFATLKVDSNVDDICALSSESTDDMFHIHLSFVLTRANV